MTKSAEAELFEEVQEVNDNVLAPISDENKKPMLGDIGWTDYVLSLLEKNEFVLVKEKRIPKTEGLRRISTKIFGKVVRSNSNPVQVLYTENGLITVATHELGIERYGNEGLVEVTGMGDAREEFLSTPFNQYVSANASTKAMGRAYRDLLQLQVLVAEELNSVNDIITTSDDPDDIKPADSAQQKAIVSTCKRLGVDVDKFISFGSFKHSSIDKVLKGTARKMMAVLNGYQSGTEIPKEIQL
jgi:hypothetical protein